jgi:hypothetical protein
MPESQSENLQPLAPFPPVKDSDRPRRSKTVIAPLARVPVYHQVKGTSVPSSGLTQPTPKPVVILPKCAEGQAPERLNTGERIEPDQGTSGESSLEVTNDPITDAVIRLVDTATNLTSRFVYLRAGDVYTIPGIEPGTYSLRFASGLDWFPTCAEFIKNGNIDEFPKPLVFEEGYKTTWKATLHGVPFGNARTNKIDKRRFLAGDQHFSLATRGQ